MSASNVDAAKGKSPPMSITLPLSDLQLDLKVANKLVSNAQTREKSLKILQYSSKLLAYMLAR
eukprot:5384501-Amphidinium_carterae.1